MPFIGNQPALSYTSFAKQDFTTSATTNYVLDQAVTNANEIALFINFVRQEPTTAYTASGNTLTLTSATTATDDMYCIFLGKALQTVNPPAGSVGASQITDGSITNAKLAGSIGLDKLASTGTLTVDNIQFPAIQVASANANNLDDYEEGNFGGNNSNDLLQPITSGTITMSRGNMAYTKIGRICNIRGEISISSVSSPVGGTYLNLPFASATSTVDRNAWGGTRIVTYNVTHTGTGLNILVQTNGGTQAQLLFEQSGGAFAPYTAGGGHNFWIDFNYLTA